MKNADRRAGMEAKMGESRAERCRGWAWPAVAWSVLLAGCAAAPVPPTTWLRLPSDVAPPQAPATAPARPVGAATAVARETWQLMLPLPMPGHLDRDSLFVPQGAAGAWVRPLAEARWLEPLRDAVPRLLREDLVRQLDGQPLWLSPLPPGLVPTRQLRIEITSFEITADGKALGTHARWSIADALGSRSPMLHAATFGTPVAAATHPEAWAVAHRQAIAALAARIAATMMLP